MKKEKVQISIYGCPSRTKSSPIINRLKTLQRKYVIRKINANNNTIALHTHNTQIFCSPGDRLPGSPPGPPKHRGGHPHLTEKDLIPILDDDDDNTQTKRPPAGNPWTPFFQLSLSSLSRSHRTKPVP
ncbi:hypothetical protein Zmor_002016 [Zophobas morio]|uniref:Uncharacterized protein n=1 Tax=Zophobas morio TaxID=2755281 RepID=A0AA38MT31_9CUCU|nr:hypothetical protein Zmor_002016 [Zophobas morio]